MKAMVSWRGDLSFDGTAETGFHLPLGAEPEVGGANDGFRPLELMALSLAGCTAMDVISILTKKRQEVKAFQVEVLAERAEEHPKVFTGAVVVYEITGQGIEESAVRRSIELSAERYCPAQGMLAKVMPIRLDYRIFEGSSPEDRELKVEGRWSAEDSGSFGATAT